MSVIRTSASHPIRVDFLPTHLPGKVGLTFAPGKHSTSKGGLRWERDLDEDLDRLVEHFGVQVLVCLLQESELEWLKIPGLIDAARDRGMEVLRLPIPDGGVLPDARPVVALVERIERRAAAGQTVAIHCAGGLGRAGTVGGCFLVHQGMSGREAVETLHRVRSRYCPETRDQERFIRDFVGVARSGPGLESRVKGAVLGATIGDAMGHPTEFIRSFEGIRRKYGPAGVQGYELYWTRDGQRFAPYTDDTQMAEAVMKGLLEGRERGEDLDGTMELIAARFVDWNNHPQGGHRGPGGACRAGCASLERGVPWREAGGKNAGGCGSVMRAYPFGLVHADDEVRAEKWAVAHSLLTHRHPMATSAAGAMAVGMVRLLRGESVTQVTSEMVAAACRHSARTAGKITRAIDEALRGIEPEVTLQRLLGWRGDEAIAAAVYTFIRHADDPTTAILEAANTPGDSDSLATLVGAMVGARGGVEALPEQWVRDVERSSELSALADRIVSES